MADHAKLQPSAAHRWGGPTPCHGSVAMEAAVPEDEESEEVREGHAAHWVCQMRLVAGWLVDVGEVAPNGVVVDQEMIDGAHLYAEYIRDTLGKAPQHVEQRTLGGAIHEDCWGTPDADHFEGNVLDVFDYKYGHRFVEVFENEQLICYAADRLAELDGLADQLVRVRFHIIQPRSFHRDGPIRTWECKASDLRGLVNHLRQCAIEASRPGAATVATPSNCRDCLARTRCDAAQAAGLDAAAVAGTSVPFDLALPEAARYLALVQRAQGQLAAMATGLEEQLIKALLKGQYVPGYRLDSTKPRERWIGDVEELFVLGDLLGHNLRAPPQPIGIAAARKLGIDDSVISQYVERPKGSVKLVPMDFTALKKVFGQ
jgi:hypothetical protein